MYCGVMLVTPAPPYDASRGSKDGVVVRVMKQPVFGPINRILHAGDPILEQNGLYNLLVCGVIVWTTRPDLDHPSFVTFLGIFATFNLSQRSNNLLLRGPLRHRRLWR